MQSACHVEIRTAAAPQAATRIEESRLTVRLAKDASDLLAVQRLRYEVFNQELRLGLAASMLSGLDQDAYDPYCDHLLVVDDAIGKVVGTYRLLLSSRRPSFGFYSETEFELDNIKRSGLRLLELGRSCVAPSHRTGRVISLLFEEIAAYARANGAEALMGCASIHGNDAAYLRSVNAFLRKNHYAGPEHWVTPRRGFDLPGLEGRFEAEESQIFRTLPPLVRGYLRLGAKVCGPPAYDRQFGTTDFFVLVEIDRIVSRYRQRFFPTMKK